MTTQQQKQYEHFVREIEKTRDLSQKEKDFLARLISSGTFMDLRSDWAFKHLMQDTDILKMLLEDFLEEKISGVEHLPNEVDRFFEGDKDATMDVLCRDEGGREFVVEIQQESLHTFTPRVFYYGASMIHSQLKRGNSYGKLRPVYVICFMDFIRPHRSDRPVYRYSMSEESTGEPLAGSLLKIIMCELQRLKKSSMEGMTAQEGWLFLLKNLHTFARVPEAMDPRFSKVTEAARLHSLPDKERLQYLNTMLSEFEKQDLIDGAYDYGHAVGMEEGAKKGVEEGMQKGIGQASAEIARRMKEAGAEPEYIKAMTGFDLSN